MEFLQRHFKGMRPDALVPLLCIVGIFIFLLIVQFLASQKSPMTGPFLLSALIFPAIMMGWFVYAAIHKVTSYDDIKPFFRSKIFYSSILIFFGAYAYII